MKITGPIENGAKTYNPQILFHGHRKKTIWLLTADRQKALIYNIDKKTETAFYRKKTASIDRDIRKIHEIELVAHAETEINPVSAGGQKTRNRVKAAAGGVPFASDPRDRENHQDDRIFIRDLSEWLDGAEKAGAFDSLIIAAAPRTQGDLRQILPPNVQNRILLTISKDLTTMTPADIGKYLETEIDLPLP